MSQILARLERHIERNQKHRDLAKRRDAFLALDAKKEIERLRAALSDVRHEICLGPINDTLWHCAMPAETTVDFICNTLGDDWDYDQWLIANANDKE